MAEPVFLGDDPIFYYLAHEGSSTQVYTGEFFDQAEAEQAAQARAVEAGRPIRVIRSAGILACVYVARP